MSSGWEGAQAAQQRANALGCVGGTSGDAEGLEACGGLPRSRQTGGQRRSRAGGTNEGAVCSLELGSQAMGEARQRGRPQPLSDFLPNTTEVESGHCARWGNGGRAEWQLSGN